MASRKTPRPVPAPAGEIRRRGPRAATLQKSDTVFATSAALIAEKGFEATSMREVSQALGVSLAGLYHYFASKEDLLFQIQYRTFAALLEQQEANAAAPGSAEERLRRLVIGHLEFFTEHPNELKVCTYELESLRGDRYEKTEAIRRRYYQLMSKAIADLRSAGVSTRESRESRHAALFVFGMLNWIFMWYDPSRYGSVEQIGQEMLELILNGLRTKGKKEKRNRSS